MLFRFVFLAILFVSPAFGQEWAAKNSDGLTAFHIALVQGNVEKVRGYLQQGAPISLPDPAGGTPLHLVAFSGNNQLLELLIHRAPDFSARNNNSWTPIMCAIASSKADVKFVKTLLAHGCVMSQEDETLLNEYARPLQKEKSFYVHYQQKMNLAREHSKANKTTSESPHL